MMTKKEIDDAGKAEYAKWRADKDKSNFLKAQNMVAENSIFEYSKADIEEMFNNMSPEEKAKLSEDVKRKPTRAETREAKHWKQVGEQNMYDTYEGSGAKGDGQSYDDWKHEYY